MNKKRSLVKKWINVFCASSEAIHPAYFKAAQELGKKMAARKWGLVYGGGNNGLMGVIANSVLKSKGHVIGVIPEKLERKGYAHKKISELLITPDLRERKTIMEQRSHAFIVLPGGIGTIEEALEVLALKQLKYHNKPVVFINTAGFYDPFLAGFQQMYSQKFIPKNLSTLYFATESLDEALDHIASSNP